MATTKEILELEHDNWSSIYLHKEGIFWKAFQKSAFQVHKMEPEFRVKITYVKVVNSEVLSVGFPEATLNRLFKQEEIEHLNEKTVRIACETVDEETYNKWIFVTEKRSLSESIAAQRAAASLSSSSAAPSAAGEGDSLSSDMLLPHSTAEKVVLQRVRGFRIEDATPIDCMVFLASIRKELHDHGNL